MRARRTLRPVVAASLLAGLVIPTSAHLVAPAYAEPTQEHNAPSVSAPAPVPAIPVPVAPAPKPIRLVRETDSTTASYRVRRGDCLWRIAEREYGSGFRWVALYRANRDQISNPDLIYPDQVLRLPSGQQAALVLPVRHASQRSTSRHASRPSTHKQAYAPASDATRLLTSQLGSSKLGSPAGSRSGGFDLSEALKQRASSGQSAVTFDPPETPASEPSGETFQGHHRVDGQFYRMKDGKLTWADDGSAVRGTWSQRLSEQIYPNRQAPLARPHAETLQLVLAPQGEPPNPVPSPDQTIQGHRRVNGTFFTLRNGRLVWADTGEAVRQERGERDSAIVSP